MRLAGISDIESANRFLEEKFTAEFNKQFMREAAGAADVHRRPSGETELADVLCIQVDRVVGLDWCVSYEGRVLQIDKEHERSALARRKVKVIDRADGTVKIEYAGKALTWKEVPQRPQAPDRKSASLADRTPWRPGPNHPWKRSSVKSTTAPATG